MFSFSLGEPSSGLSLHRPRPGLDTRVLKYSEPYQEKTSVNLSSGTNCGGNFQIKNPADKESTAFISKSQRSDNRELSTNQVLLSPLSEGT